MGLSILYFINLIKDDFINSHLLYIYYRLFKIKTYIINIFLYTFSMYDLPKNNRKNNTFYNIFKKNFYVKHFH